MVKCEEEYCENWASFVCYDIVKGSDNKAGGLVDRESVVFVCYDCDELEKFKRLHRKVLG